MNGDDYGIKGAAEMRDELAKAETESGSRGATCSELLDRLYWWAFDRARADKPCGMWAYRRVAALLTAVKHFQRGNHSMGMAWCVRIVFWPRAKPNVEVSHGANNE